MAFSDEEVAYLRSQPIARLATVDRFGQPDVVPVSFEVDDDSNIWVGGVGAEVARTRKFRNIGSGGAKVSLVVDDLQSMEPFVARALRVYGLAHPPVERVGMVDPAVRRITPTVSWSWNLAGEPAGDQWYPARRTVHNA